MSKPTPTPEDEIIDAILEDERTALIAKLRASGESDDEQS